MAISSKEEEEWIAIDRYLWDCGNQRDGNDFFMISPDIFIIRTKMIIQFGENVDIHQRYHLLIDIIWF
jgi:hypothetical protein